MTMTKEEICRDYRQAKNRLTQVGILADLNGCTKADIKQILIDGGCELPGQMKPKPKGPRKQVQEAKPKAAEAPAKAKTANDVALDTIGEIMSSGMDAHIRSYWVDGVMKLFNALKEAGLI